MAEATKPPGATGGPAAASVAPGHQGNKPAANAAPVSALVSVPKFGGNRGGKKRADGLAPGSPEAKAADNAKDAERKRLEREEKRRLAQPPALPSALAPAPGATDPASGTQNPDATAAGLSAPSIQWHPDMLKEFTDEIVNAVEAHGVSRIAGAASEAGLPPDLVKNIRQDSHYPAGAKRGVQLATPQVACKWLNKAGVSAEYAAEVALVTSAAAIMVHQRKITSKLEELIEHYKRVQDKNAKAQANQNNPQAPQAPKANP